MNEPVEKTDAQSTDAETSHEVTWPETVLAKLTSRSGQAACTVYLVGMLVVTGFSALLMAFEIRLAVGGTSLIASTLAHSVLLHFLRGLDAKP